ncbi:MAG: tetratricopeptide repeat protein [Acidobacteriota bacterium]
MTDLSADATIPRGGTCMAEARTRSATASIRGYLYQTILAAREWLALGPDEVLVVEGDEDYDRILRGDDAADDEPAEQVSVQVKHRDGELVSPLSGGLGSSLAAFARAWQARDGKTLRFVYVSTERHRKPARGNDVLGDWIAGKSLDAVAEAVAEAVRRKAKDEDQAALPAEPNEWRTFVEAVTLRLDRPRLAEARRDLETAIDQDPRSQDLGHAGALPARLVDHLLTTSSQDDLALRRRTRSDLDALIQDARTRLGGWAASSRGRRLVGWFDAATTLERVLEDGSRPVDRPELPSQMLTASYEVVPFFAEQRHTELEDFAAWCAQDKPRCAARVLVGAGGEGKTRLLLEVCKRQRSLGWHAGFVPIDTSAAEAKTLGDGAGARLLVVDYAETRVDLVTKLLRAVDDKRVSARVRVVLGARQDGPWFTELRQSEERFGSLLVAAPQRLAQLTTADDRPAIFQAMIEAFAQARGVEPPPAPTIDLEHPSLDLALLLAMAALEALDGEVVVGTEEILDATLAHEWRFWKRWLEKNGVKASDGSRLSSARAAVALLTLHGRFHEKAAARAILQRFTDATDALDPDVPVNTLTRMVGVLYGTGTPQARGLEPDILGEHIVLRALEASDDPAAWLVAALADADEGAVQNALVVLGRLGIRLAEASAAGTDREAIEAWVRAVLTADLEARALPAFEAAKALGEVSSFAPIADALASVVEGDGSDAALAVSKELLRELDRQAIPPVSLRRLAVACSLVAVDAERSMQPPPSDQAELARRLNNLGSHLAALGRTEKALQATRDAADLRRDLARARPDAHNPDLATALNNLGNHLAALGRTEDALQATRDAAELYRDLARARPDAYNPDLAMALNNLGSDLAALGRTEDALQATQEAAKLYRDLARARPDAYTPVLVRSLYARGLVLTRAGRECDAVETFEEARTLIEPFARRLEAAFQPLLDAIETELQRAREACGDVDED